MSNLLVLWFGSESKTQLHVEADILPVPAILDFRVNPRWVGRKLGKQIDDWSRPEEEYVVGFISSD